MGRVRREDVKPAPLAASRPWPVRLAVAAVIVGLAGVPLGIAPGLVLQYETTPKLALLLIATAGLLLCPGAWWPGAARLLAGRQGRAFTCLLAAQIALLAVSTALAPRPGLSLGGSAWRRYGLVTQVAVVLFCWLCAALAAAHPWCVRKIVPVVAWAGGAIALYGIAQYAGLDPLLDRKLYTIAYNGDLLRVPGTLGAAVYFGSFLAAAIPLALGLTGEAKGAAKRVYWAIALLALAAVILSGTRSALIAIAAAAAVSAPALRTVQRRTVFGVAGGATVVVAVLAALTASPAGASFRLRLQQWRQDAMGGPRLGVWRESLALAGARPWVGYGAESFGSEFRRRQTAAISRAYPEHFQESPHNFLLDGTIAEGVLFLGFAGGIGILIVGGKRMRGEEAWLRASTVATGVSLLFITVAISGAVMFYGMLGLLIATRTPPETPGARRMPRLARPAAILLAVIFGGLAILYVRKDAAYSALREAAPAGRLDAMREAYRSSTATWFPASGDDLWCSRQFARVAGANPAVSSEAWSLAAEASARAELTGDNPAEAAYQSALIAIGINRAQAAELELRKAIAYAPTWHKPRSLLAQLLHFTGRAGEAQAEARKALDFAGAARPAAEQTLREIGLQ